MQYQTFSTKCYEIVATYDVWHDPRKGLIFASMVPAKIPSSKSFVNSFVNSFTLVWLNYCFLLGYNFHLFRELPDLSFASKSTRCCGKYRPFFSILARFR